MASTDFPEVSQAETSRFYCFLSALRLAIALIFKLAAVFGKNYVNKLKAKVKNLNCAYVPFFFVSHC